MNAPLLVLKDVTVHVGSEPVLESLNLRIEPSHHILISGPSGSGKTTLLHTLARLIEPNSGTYHYQGVVAQQLPSPARFRLQEIGFVFQSFNLIHSLSVLDNLKMVSAASDKQSALHAATLLEPLGLLNKQNRKAERLSRGERQRVALARAFANAPRLVLADEPTSSLDPAYRDTTLSLLFELAAQQGVTLVVVSHDTAMQGDSRFRAHYALEGGRLRVMRGFDEHPSIG